MKIIDWDPAEGDICQGDVILFRVPDGLVLSTAEEIKPRDSRLILAEGEVTGHHHAIWFPRPTMFRDDAMARELAKEWVATPTQLGDIQPVPEAAVAGTAKLYRDAEAVRRLTQQGELLHGRLAIGFLIVAGGPVVLRHDEHDAVRIPPGRYYVGGQAEWDAAEERRVAD